MKHFGKIAAVHSLCNLVAIGDGMGYAALAILPHLEAADRQIALEWAIAVSLATYVILTPLFFFLTRRLRDVMGKLEAGEAIDPERLEKARRDGLNLPITFSRLCLLAWLGGIVTLPPVSWFCRMASPGLVILHGMTAMVVIGTLATVFVYYAWEFYTRCFIVPELFPEGRLSEVAGAGFVSIPFKISILVLTTAVLPVAVLTVVALTGTANAPTILFVGGGFLCLGLVQAGFICRSISRPIEDLTREMEKVRDDDLSAHAPVFSNDEVGRLAEGFNQMVEGLRQGAFVRETFGRYVTNQVRDEILRGGVELGGERRTATVLFSDIRGFTALSESLSPEKVVAFLNRYLDIMVEVLYEEGGTIDKFIGDAILASFGVPLDQDDDALRAVRAACGMLERLEAWNEERRARSEPPIEIGIGLHTGPVVAGNIGSERKMEYTVIGDTVNTTSRIEQLNKNLQTNLLISDATFQRVRDRVEVRELEPVEVKGKKDKVRIYEVLGMKN